MVWACDQSCYPWIHGSNLLITCVFPLGYCMVNQWSKSEILLHKQQFASKASDQGLGWPWDDLGLLMFDVKRWGSEDN